MILSTRKALKVFCHLIVAFPPRSDPSTMDLRLDLDSMLPDLDITDEFHDNLSESEIERTRTPNVDLNGTLSQNLPPDLPPDLPQDPPPNERSGSAKTQTDQAPNLDRNVARAPKLDTNDITRGNRGDKIGGKLAISKSQNRDTRDTNERQNRDSGAAQSLDTKRDTGQWRMSRGPNSAPITPDEEEDETDEFREKIQARASKLICKIIGRLDESEIVWPVKRESPMRRESSIRKENSKKRESLKICGYD